MLKTLIAMLRLNKTIVCEKSKGLGYHDYHDYPDSITPEPWHFYRHTCVRCGKTFFI